MGKTQKEEEEGGAETNISRPFLPDKIKITTFQDLLSYYPSTAKEVQRRKIAAKLRSKGVKAGSKKKTVGPPPSAPESESPPLDQTEQNQLDADLDAFVKLDEWRYTTLPKLIAERRVYESESAPAPAKESTRGGYIDKEELVKLMQWKLSHGHFRPTLMGMAKSNNEAVVRRSTQQAFSSFYNDYSDKSTDASDSHGNEEAEMGEEEAVFPQTSLDALTTALRGVGPATASLILSVGTSTVDTGDSTQPPIDVRVSEVPFFSDELYIWLCVGICPSFSPTEGKLVSNQQNSASAEVKKIKYNLGEYKQLYRMANQLKRRLKRAITRDIESDGGEVGGRVSMRDIEKVAYVLGHIDVSGYVFSGKEGDSRKKVNDAGADAEEDAKVELKRLEDGSRRELKRTAASDNRSEETGQKVDVKRRKSSRR